MEKYSLEVISRHSESINKLFKKYKLDGLDTIGVFNSEPFEIKFKNNTYQPVQVKISLDGTDIITGEMADTEVNNDMWLVAALGTLSLKAWAETNSGGAEFIFTNTANGVARHLHGDLSSQGVIAAAVFTEGHVEPIKWVPSPVVIHEHHYPYYKIPPYYWADNSYWTITCGLNGTGNICTQSSISYNSSNELSNVYSCSNNSAAIGAGEYIDQPIAKAAGLIEPILTETIKIRYMWWKELKKKLKNNVSNYKDDNLGFPGDVKRNNFSLKDVPKVGKKTKQSSNIPASRFL